MAIDIHMQDLTAGGRRKDATTIRPVPINSSPSPKLPINITRREHRGYARTFPLEVKEGETLVEFMGHLKTRLGANRWKVLMRKIILFEEEAIFEAPLCSVIACAYPDAEGGAALVDLGPPTFSALLTEAYHDAQALGELVDVESTLKRYETRSVASQNIAIVLGWKKSEKLMTINLSILGALSIIIGMVIGVVCSDANLGVTVGGGLFAVLGVVVALLVIVAK